jgi:succinyl-diaminopimelate desuccinylase
VSTPLTDTVEREIDGRREELIGLCACLVATPSMSPPGETVETAKVVRAFLAGNGLECETVACDPKAPNLVAHVGTPGRGRHVVFNAHMDTMQPGDASRWTVPVLELTRRQSRLYGLGMGNMKGALAGMCVATAVLSRHAGALAGRLTMTAVCDEVMFGERGAVHLLAARPDVHGDFLISGEGPGFMEVALAEKGLLWIDIEARSAGGHSSRALKGATAVAKLAAMLGRIDGINEMFATIPPEVEGIVGGEGNLGLRVSLNAGTVAAGGVRSLIATRAHAEIDVRLPPGITAASIVARVRAAAAKDPNIVVTEVKAWDASYTPLNDPVVSAVAEAAEHVRGKRPSFVVRLPGSDARRWRDLGVPAVCYGPQPELSAGVDDYCNEQDVMDCAKVYARAALRLMSLA